MGGLLCVMSVLIAVVAVVVVVVVVVVHICLAPADSIAHRL